MANDDFSEGIREQTNTTWLNPTSLPVSVLIFVGHGVKKGHTHRRFVVQPGERKQLPSEYDAAIHMVHNGVVVGGGAPQLVRCDGEEPSPVHDALVVDLPPALDASKPPAEKPAKK